MSVQVLSDGRRVARKEHQCFDCYRPIRKGESHCFQTCKYDDHIYTIRQHHDCRQASRFYQDTARFDPWLSDYEGIPPLADMISDNGEIEIDHAILRGHFPHVVCRLEFSDQLAALRLGEPVYG